MDPTVRPNSEQIPYEGGGLSVILQVLSRRQQGVLLVPRGSRGPGRRGPQRQARPPAAAQLRGADAQCQGGRGDCGAGGI